MTKQLQTNNKKGAVQLAGYKLTSLVKIMSIALLGLAAASCQTIGMPNGKNQAPLGQFEARGIPAAAASIPSTAPAPSVATATNSAVTGTVVAGTPVDLRPAVPTRSAAPSNNMSSMMRAPDRSADAGRYEVNPGDILEIAVFPIDELKRRVEVDSVGRVNLPLIGEARVAGKSTLEIARDLAGQYRGRFVRDPNVSVLVVEKVNQRYTVSGLVKLPGTFPIENNQTMLGAIAKSGGLADTADFRTVILRRVIDGATLSVPFDVRAIEAGNAVDPRIFSGDVIIAAGTGSRISVAGTVERPGLFPMTGPISITQAVALAGGIQRGTNPANISLFRPVGDTVQTYTYGRYDLEAGRIADPQLIAGDRVVVEQRDSKVSVSGAVAQSGTFAWTPGLKLSSAIALARGVTILADSKQVLILREINGETKAARFDIIKIQDGSAEDPLLLDGDRVFVGTDRIRDSILTYAPLASFLNVFAVLGRN